MRPIQTALYAASTAMLFASTHTLAAEPMQLADLLPAETMFVAGTDDWSDFAAQLEGSAFHELWNDSAIQTWRNEIVGDNDDQTVGEMKALAQFFGTLNGLDPAMLAGLDSPSDSDTDKIPFELEEIFPPAGIFGIGMWPASKNANDESVPSILFVWDGGSKADRMEELLFDFLEQEEKDGENTLDKEAEYAGETIYAIRSTQENNDEEDEYTYDETNPFDQVFGDFDDNVPGFFVRVDDTFVLTTDLQQLEHAIDRLHGDDPENETLRSNPQYDQARSDIGKDTLLYAIALLDPIWEAIEQQDMDDEQREENDAIFKMLRILGIRQIQNIATGVQFGSNGIALETLFSISLEERTGLFALPKPIERFAAPSFVSADSTMLLLANINIDDVINLTIKSIQASAGDEPGFSPAMMIEQGLAMVRPILQGMNDDLAVSMEITQPYNADSQNFLVSCGVAAYETVRTGVQQLALQMGTASRELHGEEIWEMDGSGQALSLTKNRLYFGGTPTVENALQLENKGVDLARLADESHFQNIARHTTNGGVFYSFNALKPMLEYSKWQSQNWENILRAQYESFGAFDEAQIDQMVEEQREFRPAANDAFPYDAVFQHIGNAFIEIHATPTRIHGRNVQLEAGE